MENSNLKSKCRPGREDGEKRIDPGVLSMHFDGFCTDADDGATHSSLGLFTAPALPGHHVRSHAARDMWNVRGNVFLEVAVLFAFQTRNNFSVCCVTQADALIYGWKIIGAAMREWGAEEEEESSVTVFIRQQQVIRDFFFTFFGAGPADGKWSLHIR